jgi:hypothetical protein
MTRRHTCDVPGCGKSRERWQRICGGCFRQLPGDVRHQIIDGHRCKDHKRHRAGIKAAAQHLAASAGQPARPSPTQAYQAQQRLLGERDD